MRTYLIWPVFALYLTQGVPCAAANVAPTPLPPLSCRELRTSPITDSKQRRDIAQQGFSILPPQGEHWCYRPVGSSGASFFKLPRLEDTFEALPSRDKAIPTSRVFGAMAMSLKGFINLESSVASPDDLKSLVHRLIGEDLFSQLIFGLKSAQHRYHVLESNVTTYEKLATACVRFNATVEERGSPTAPAMVFLLNLPSNLVCRHPTPPEIGLVWVGFAERYIQGRQPAADTLKDEYEPYIESLQFMQPR